MSDASLNKILRELQVLNTDLGDFSYIGSLGEGGNSFVFHYRKGSKDFAIKLLKPSDDRKLARFKDEYFCAVQIETQKNVAQMYHFDLVEIQQETFFAIVMKHYQGTLHKQGTIQNESATIKAEKGWKLFSELATALHHLHKNNIIHRDIKPQNIFFDESIDQFVLGDLGIAHFAAESFPKESITKPAERLANYSFSAPEQIDSKNPAKPSNDIYSLGQVLQWYLTGTMIRGLGRTRLSDSESPEKLRWLDSIIDKCLSNDPANRFQSITEIHKHVKDLSSSPIHKDYWVALHQLDNVIRETFPKIRGILIAEDKKYIHRFFSNFKSQCNPQDFWYMTMKGGDNTFEGLVPLDDQRWLLNKEVELAISKLIIYRDEHAPYKNFFVVLVSPDQPFEIVDSNGNRITRNIPKEWDTDIAVFWNERYIDSSETRNGYYETGEQVIPVTRDVFNDRIRHLKQYAYIIVPQGTATAVMNDRTPTEELLMSIVETGNLSKISLDKYLDNTRPHHSKEILMYV